MNGTLLLTIQSVAKAGDDVLVLPALSAEEYSLGAIDRVRIVTPDRLVFEKDAEFGIPFDTTSPVYTPDTKCPERGNSNRFSNLDSLEQHPAG